MRTPFSGRICDVNGMVAFGIVEVVSFFFLPFFCFVFYCKQSLLSQGLSSVCVVGCIRRQRLVVDYLTASFMPKPGTEPKTGEP